MINIYIQPLARLLERKLNDFSQRRDFIAYQKQQIYQYRNQLLSQILKQPIENDELGRTEFGKPFLVQHPKLAFNHSHSQQHYALAVSQQVSDVGVDIEDLSRQVRFEALAQHAFHPDEYAQWQALDYDPIYWFKVWTTKEAVLKAHGLGIRLSLNSLNTQVHAVADGGRCEHAQLGMFAYQNYQLPHCMLTVAWRSEQSCKGLAFPTIQIHQ